MLSKLLISLFVLILLFALIAVAVGYSISAPGYSGPVSDHFDGKQFFNPSGAKAKGFGEVIGWMFRRKRTPWGRYRPHQTTPPPPERVEGSDVRVTFVNHSTVLLQFDGINVLTDPVWYERTSPFQWLGPKRNTPPGIAFDELPPIDVVLLSHNHWDHLDIDLLRNLYLRDSPQLYCPLGLRMFLQNKGCLNVTEMDWGQSAPFNARTRIHCVQAQHFSGRGMFDRDATLWAGFVIESQTVGNLYFVGDTGYGDFFKKIGDQFGPLRLALIPIGAYKPEWFMSPIHCSPAEAVKIHQDVRAQQSVGIHFGTFPLADDGETEPVEDLRRSLQAVNLPADRFWTLQEGEGRLVPQRPAP